MMRMMAAAAAMLLAVPAQALVIGFDDLAGESTRDIGAEYDSPEGFRFTVAPDNSFSPNAYLLVWGAADSANADPGGATLTTGFVGNVISISRINGDSFTLNAIDLADPFAGDAAGDVLLTLVRSSGETVRTLTLPGIAGLSTFRLDEADLIRVRLQPVTTRGPWVQIDNLRMDEAAGVIPEPATWAMLIAGFGLVGGMARRRRARAGLPQA